MSFFFDARFIRAGHHDGISRFAANLFSELSKTRELTAIISDLDQLQHLTKDISFVLECEQTSIKELGLARRMNRRGAKLIYSPMQTTGSLGKKFKLVLTLHDLIYYRHPKPPSEFNPIVRALWRAYHWSFLPARMILAKADGLVTISQTSLELIRQAKLFKGKIAVVYNAAESSYQNHVHARTQPKSNNLVYMGSFMDYKDVETLVVAAGLLPDFELHLLSRIQPIRRIELEKLAAKNGATVVFHNGVSDEQYLDILDSAFALVSASRDEGFGIPVIESMARGTPVVCSGIEIFREVGANAAVYFEVGNAADLAASVKSLQGEWATKSTLSIKNVERFDWKQSASELNDYLDEVLKN